MDEFVYQAEHVGTPFITNGDGLSECDVAPPRRGRLTVAGTNQFGGRCV
jgi:hypothetical protein